VTTRYISFKNTFIS